MLGYFILSSRRFCITIFVDMYYFISLSSMLFSNFISQVKWNSLLIRLPVPLLNLLQAVTFRLTHEKDNHGRCRETTSCKEVVRAKRRLIKQHWRYESHDVVSSLNGYVSTYCDMFGASLTQFELCARLEALLLVRLGILSTTHVRKPMAHVKLKVMAKR
jgi:hypothetical protein